MSIMGLHRKGASSEKTGGGLLARGNPFMIMRCMTMCCQRGREGLPV